LVADIMSRADVMELVAAYADLIKNVKSYVEQIHDTAEECVRRTSG
jgi:hypothetical protein